ncbi:hypothetical protein [Hasllibacter sp. MH4015]|uniref:hypothetical protein n=1 Tax=Hasllibacter sp. MH4015 TaxID=2854029 RepID=UPI001CD8062F|nr:hypothetical protein [Hasllibacter sp. MH4015]
MTFPKTPALAAAGLLWCAMALTAAAQDPGWYRTGERLDLALTDDAALLQENQDDGVYSEIYVIGDVAANDVQIVIQISTTWEGHPDSAMTPERFADFALQGAAQACPDIRLVDREEGGVAALPSHTLNLTCPGDAAQGVPETSYVMVAARGPTRMHFASLIMGPDTPPGLLIDYVARINAADICEVPAGEVRCGGR